MKSGPVIRSQAIWVPDSVWGRLASVADDRGTTIEDLLVIAINDITQAVTVEERIIQLVRAGFTDAVIASKTGKLLGRVAEIRRAAHLPANKYVRGVRATNNRRTA